MNVNELAQFRELIYEKLKRLERKLELSSINTKQNDKLISLGKDLITIRKILQKLSDNVLTWNDLEAIGIQKSHLLKYETFEYTAKKQNLEDFSLLENIPHTTYFKSTNNTLLNDLYSIIDYININYQVLFTQKTLLASDKTNNIREQFYLQYQEIIRLFKNYSEFLDNNERLTRDSNLSTIQEQLLYKEYTILLKKILTFLYDIKNYIYKILSDSTFSQADLKTKIVSNDPEISIYGLTLLLGLEECKLFVEESLEYIVTKEKDFIDSINIEQ